MVFVEVVAVRVEPWVKKALDELVDDGAVSNLIESMLTKYVKRKGYGPPPQLKEKDIPW